MQSKQEPSEEAPSQGFEQDEAEPSQSYVSGSGSGSYASESASRIEGQDGTTPVTPNVVDGKVHSSNEVRDSKEAPLEEGEESSEKPQEETKMNFADVAIKLKEDKELYDQLLKEKQDKSGRFEVHEKTVMYDRRSLFIFDRSFWIRKKVVWLIEWKWFDNFVTFIILANSIALAMTDYKERVLGPDYVSKINEQLEYVDLAFTSIFIAECVFKIIGMGFVWHRNSYLRDIWNWLDFFVVCISIINFFPGVDSGGLKALRTFRILRPLRTINAIPLMKQQISSLMTALPGLGNVLTFLIFVYSIFAIFAVQSFAGNQYQFCRTQMEPDIVRDADGTLLSYDWPIVDTFSWLCTTDKDCEKLIKEFGPEDLDVYKCGQSITYNITAGGEMKIDATIENEQILFDVVNFNHMGLAFLTIFQCLTMESWTTMMYNYMDSNNVYIAVFFFVFMILFGSFFTMQLVLAEIIDSYERENQRKQVEARDKQLEIEKQARIEEVKRKKEEEDAIKAAGGTVIDKLDTIPEPEEKEEVAEVLDDSAWEDETVAERDSRRRSHENKCFGFFYKLVINSGFQFFIFLMILANTVSLAADDYPSSNRKDEIISYCNQYFTWLFTVEMIFKLIALGPKNYRQDTYNMFDGFIVTVSLVDWAITTLDIPLGAAGSVLQALRAMRLLRIIKLARRWTALQEILGKIFESLSDIGVYCMLLLLFMYIFALLGMQFFALRSVTDIDGVVVPAEDILERALSGEPLISARDNFDNIGFSLTTVFCVIFAEDWNWDMYANILTFGTSLHYYAIFFIVVFAFGNYVLFALFTAILLSHFDSEGTDDDDEVDEGMSTTASELAKPNIFKRIFSKETGRAICAEFESMFGARPLAKKPEQVIEEVDLDELSDQEPNEFGERAVEGDTNVQPSINKIKPTPKKKNQNSSDGSEQNSSEEGQEKNEGMLTTKLSRSTSVLLRHYSIDPEDEAIQNVDYSDVRGNAFFCFGPKNPCRKFFATIEKSKPFNNIILILIVISTINLAIETPLDKPGVQKLVILGYIDYFMTAAFTCEMLIKWFTYGFAFTGKTAYIKQGWNVLDFLIVMSALMGLNPNATQSLKSLKTLRILRVLRPLKLASKNKGLKVAITALFKSLPAIGNLQLIIVFFLFLFGILHTTLLGGQFWSCSFDHVSMSYEQKMELIKTDKDCFNYGGEWVNNDFNFDTTMRSILTLFCIQSTEGWVGVMWAEVDTTDRYMQPVMNQKPFYIVFGIFIEILINLLFLNLFVGVVIETFNQEKEKINKNNLLRFHQRSWISVQLMGYQASPVLKQQLTGGAFRDFTIKFCEHWLFDSFIMICIITNTIVLMIKWYAMSQAVIDTIQLINYVFMAIFTIEAIIKLFALRNNYFKVGWNIFDFTVVVGTLVILVIGFLDLGEFGIQSTILRSLRIGRVMRLLRKMKKLQIIFNTLSEALPSMGSLGMLLLLLMFMYAIIGMSQFGFINTTDQENADYHANFKNFLNSFLLLFRSATGEGWDSLMFDFGRGNSITFQCVSEMEYPEYEANGMVTNKCGSPTIAYCFFVSFIIFCVQVFLNLFVAVIVDSFANQSLKADLPVQAMDIEIFCEVWRDYDGEAKGFIETKHIEEFIIQLASDSSQALIMFATRIKSRDPKKAHFRRKYIADLDVPTFKNFKWLMFYDVLLAMIKQKAKFVFEQEAFAIRREMEAEISEMKKNNNEGLTHEQIIALCKSKYTIEFDGQFDTIIESFTELGIEIDLINDVRNKSALITKQFKLNKDKADEGYNNETGDTWYYTTRMYIYGTFVTAVWRQSMANKKAEAAAAYGEIINGKRKIQDKAKNALMVPKRSYLPAKKPRVLLNDEVDVSPQGLGAHLASGEDDDIDEMKPDIQKTPNGIDQIELGTLFQNK